MFGGGEKGRDILHEVIRSVTKEAVPIRKGRKDVRGKTAKVKRKTHRAYVSVV